MPRASGNVGRKAWLGGRLRLRGALVIDQDRLQRNGAVSLQRTANGFTIDAVRPRGLDRPWSRAIPDEPQHDLIQSGRPPQNRPADATPAETDLQPEDQ